MINYIVKKITSLQAIIKQFITLLTMLIICASLIDILIGQGFYREIYSILLQDTIIIFTSWSSIILILAVIFKDPLISLLRSSITIKWKKDFMMMIQAQNIPDEAKILLTKQYVTETSVPLVISTLKCLKRISKALENIKNIPQNVHHSVDQLNSRVTELLDSLEELDNLLSLLALISAEKKKKTRDFIAALRTPPAESGQFAFSAIGVSMEMDPNFAEKDPRDYLFIQELEEELLKILSISEKAS